MKKFSKIMLIIGTVIGSGFASGKEIAVFFSRFGMWSYLFILLSFFLFWGVFYLIMQRGSKATKKLDNSKFFLGISVAVSMVFTSSMFAGTRAIIKTSNFALNVMLIVLLLIACIIISRKQVEILAKINMILIPFILIALFAIVAGNLQGDFVAIKERFGVGVLYAFLYVALNTSLSSIVIARSQPFSKRENFWISFAASFFLLLMLSLINTAILKHPDVMSANMPMLELASGAGRVIMAIVIAIGCLTTLFSLVFTTYSSLVRLKVPSLLCTAIAIFVPFLASFIGFGDIVSYVYPVASVLGLSLFYLYL